jgi:hypothetical protein
VARLEKQIADLQPRIALQQKILADAQAELKAGVRPLAMTPAEAVASFQKDPKQPVTVEFGVAPIGFPDGPSRHIDDAGSPMVLAWDNLFPGGGTFSAVVPRRVYLRLADFAPAPPNAPLGGDAFAVELAGEPSSDRLRQRITAHLEANGIRIIGIVERHGDNYVINVTDPAQVIVYIKGSGRLGLHDD